MLCEMERGSFTWVNKDRIDRIRRAHAQKHVSASKQSWGRADGRKPWFCKNFQTNSCSFSRDHKSNGHLHKCLTQGKQLGHSVKTKVKQKNEIPAAHH